VNYQTLPPGSYRFVVYARNSDGYWSVSPASIAFTILPPWWQMWWIKLLALAAVLLLVIVIFRVRLSKIRRRERKKSELQNRIAGIELTALRAQMNPHFVFNAINSVQYFITNNDPDSSQKYLTKFGRLIRYVLDNSKLTTIPVQKELDALELYLDLEALRFGKKLSYAIDVHPGVDTKYTQIPSMLIQPYVENAIWHGIMHSPVDGRLTVSLEMEDGILKCTVEDNGIGRQKSQALKQEKGTAHTSMGMSNTKERLEIINQVNATGLSVTVTDLYHDSGEARGTRVAISIPCN
jgi:sensor histidine kinase YesM